MELWKEVEDRDRRTDVDDHLIIPLSTQVITILRNLHKFTGNGVFVFMSTAKLFLAHEAFQRLNT